ncbi:MAG: ATP-binding protein [Planctomycetota bacterium]
MTGNPPAPSRHELILDLPAVHREVRVARNVVRHFARLSGMADREVDYVILVASELLANAIDHGGGDAALTEGEHDGVRMRLQLAIEAREWVLSVTDQGGGDPEELRALFARGEKPDLATDRGRGLFLLAQMLDRLEVTASERGDGLTFRAVRRYEP